MCSGSRKVCMIAPKCSMCLLFDFSVHQSPTSSASRPTPGHSTLWILERPVSHANGSFPLPFLLMRGQAKLESLSPGWLAAVMAVFTKSSPETSCESG